MLEEGNKRLFITCNKPTCLFTRKNSNPHITVTGGTHTTRPQVVHTRHHGGERVFMSTYTQAAGIEQLEKDVRARCRGLTRRVTVHYFY